MQQPVGTNPALLKGGLVDFIMDASIIAYAGQKNLFDRFEVLSNNIANANTSGFKADLSVYMKPTGNINGQPNPLPALKSAVDLSQGGLRATGRQMDAAIQGDGFFQVDTPLGPRYTRSGTFFTDASGALVTKEGYSVVGDGGPITLNPEDYTIKIGEDGTITATTLTGEEVRGKLGVFKFADKSQLEKVGNTLFRSEGEPETAEPVIDYKVAQGMVEDSNVNQIQEMTNLIDISRSVQNMARIIQDEDQRVRTAVQRIAGTRS